MNCAGCHQPIPTERLEAIPGVTHCVKCLSAGGDVRRVRGVVVYDHKTAGALQVLTSEQLAARREAEASIEDRVSRL